MENFRKNLSEKKWFRTLADRVFGKGWVILLLGLGSIPCLLAFVAPESSVPAGLIAASGLCYGLTLLGQLLLSLDFYEENAKKHFGNFLVELLILAVLVAAGKLGYLEQAAQFLF